MISVEMIATARRLRKSGFSIADIAERIGWPVEKSLRQLQQICAGVKHPGFGLSVGGPVRRIYSRESP